MKFPIKRTILAVVVAVAVASVLLAVGSPPTAYWIQQLVFIFLSVLTWGWAAYVPLVVIHYWLLKKVLAQQVVTSTMLGAGLGISILAIGRLLDQLPVLSGSAVFDGLALACGGATYGFLACYRQDRATNT